MYCLLTIVVDYVTSEVVAGFSTSFNGMPGVCLIHKHRSEQVLYIQNTTIYLLEN